MVTNLLSENPIIESIVLGDVEEIEEKSIQILFDSLKKNKTLKKFEISVINLEPQWIKFISEMFVENSSLEVFRLTNIGDFFQGESAEQFFESLKRNKSIKELDLTGNYFSEEKISFLCELIKFNSPILKKIGFTNNNINISSLNSIHNSLKFNFHLTQLTLFEREIENHHLFILRKSEIDFLLSCNKKWKPKKHVYFQKSFKESVFTFVVCLKEKQKTLFFKLGKFVWFEIIKMIDRRSFKPNTNKKGQNKPQEDKSKKRKRNKSEEEKLSN